MLDFAVEYKAAIHRITTDLDLGLKKHNLDDEEWEIVEQLRDVLKLFENATTFFSRKGHVNLPIVIPAMDHLDEKLTEHALDTGRMTAAVRAAVTLGKKTLNRYYDRTDHTEVYRIAMVLHPQMKLEYFKTAKWEQDWIDTA
ncbi:uncharacterized protein BXZ73DRAFT_54351, partial [Epithele typhae]|uniref:uncharacterized protein n=1 Tax=Epithele typhae TaxID=378194 RepID=UPI002007C92E